MSRNTTSGLTGATIIRPRLHTKKECVYIEKFAELNFTDVKIANRDCVWCDSANCIMYDVDLMVSDDMIWRLGIVEFGRQLEHYIDTQIARDEDTKAKEEELEALREKAKRLEAELVKRKQH